MPNDKSKIDPTRPDVSIASGPSAPPRRLSLPTPWRLPRPLLERAEVPIADSGRARTTGIGDFDHHTGEHAHECGPDCPEHGDPNARNERVPASEAEDAPSAIGDAAWQDPDESDDELEAEERIELDVFDDPSAAPTPLVVLELAASAVRFVASALIGLKGAAGARDTTSVEPDFTPETLPIVDHYLRDARTAVNARPESVGLVAQALGAYLGEVVRRAHACWWRTESEDPLKWRLDFRDVYISFYPVELASALLLEPSGDYSGLALHDSVDREAVVVRLRDLPDVSADEYELASTRLEVLDIAVDALSRRRIRDRTLRRIYRPEDYG